MVRNTLVSRFAALGVVAMASLATAGESVSPQQWSSDGFRALPVAVEGELRLSLAEASGLALSRNLDLVVAKIDTGKSRLGIDEAKGIFDLNLTGYLQTAKDESPSAAETVFGSESKSRAWNLGISQLLLPGTVWNVAWNNSRRETNASFNTINPYFTSGLNLTVSQPLLKNFGPEPTSYGLAVARLSRKISAKELETQVRRKLVDVENAYWLLVAERENLAVKRSSLALAEDLLRITKIRVDVGTLAPIEIVGSEAGVARREEDIIRAEAAVADAEDSLKRLLNVPRESWSLNVVPTDEVATETPSLDESELESAVDFALAHRPELEQSRWQVQSSQLGYAFRRNQALPSLDLSANYGYAGLGGDVRCSTFDPECDPTQVDEGGWGDAVDQVKDRDFPSWSIALNFAMPLTNRSERARRTAARLELERSQTNLQNAEQGVLHEVRMGARGVQTASKAVMAAEKALVLADRNLDAARKKYENGMATNFEVLEIEQQLAEAKSGELAARLAYRRAVVAFHAAKGDLLAVKGVDIVAADSPEATCWVGCFDEEQE